MEYQEQLDGIKTYISAQFGQYEGKNLSYHNIEHTRAVVANALKIAGFYELNDRDTFIVLAAAWFHDVGYLTSCENHESTGAERAGAFLRGKGLEPAVLEEIRKCILSTKMPQKPEGLLQEIVCDADLYHLGTPDFSEWNKRIRKEAGAFCGHKIDKEEWRLKTIQLFEMHHYHTTYCQENLNAEKEKNLIKLKNMPDTENKEKKNVDLKKETELKKKKEDRPDRGIETMFRISSTNHQRLSDMADNKAHIMISTTSIILSIVLSVLLRKLEDNSYLTIPTFILLIVCVVTMVFAILATRPSIPAGVFTREQVSEKKVNLLFFGNFYRMKMDDFEEGMHRVMEDKEFLYNSLIRDLYAQGVVLGRKYRYLRVGYNIFMYGIVTSVLAFIIASVWVSL